MSETTSPALGNLWTVSRADEFGGGGGWEQHPILRITPKRIWIAHVYSGGRQMSFDRAELEREGRVFWFNGTDSRSFYTDAYKLAREHEREHSAA